MENERQDAEPVPAADDVRRLSRYLGRAILTISGFVAYGLWGWKGLLLGFCAGVGGGLGTQFDGLGDRRHRLQGERTDSGRAMSQDAECVRCGVCNADGYVLDDSGTAMVPCPRCCAAHFAKLVVTSTIDPVKDSQGHRRPDRENRDGWPVWDFVTCVECPGCGFTFSADHTDVESGGYSCSECGYPHALIDGCQHTEHAIRPGFGRVGRYFEGLNDQAGKWERCPRTQRRLPGGVMNEQETRQKLADAILRGEAVCYGMRFEQRDDGFHFETLPGCGPGHCERNVFIGFQGPFHVGGTHNDGVGPISEEGV